MANCARRTSLSEPCRPLPYTRAVALTQALAFSGTGSFGRQLRAADYVPRGNRAPTLAQMPRSSWLAVNTRTASSFAAAAPTRSGSPAHSLEEPADHGEHIRLVLS